MNNRLIFRAVAFTLAFYFFVRNIIYGSYVIQIEGATWGGGLRFLTNWNLLLNFIIATCALVNERDRNFISYYFLLPGSMVLNVLVFLLYWLIRLFGGFGVQTEDWSIFQILSDYYAHFGTSAFLFYEVILYSKAFKNPSKELPVFAGIFVGYITWMEFFVQINNTAPCGVVSCGFPYEFLNDLDYIGRLIFYGIVLFMGVSSWIGCKKLVKGPGHSLF